MSDQPESLAAALAELRARAEEERDCGWDGEADDLIAFADRIEAAAERERDAYNKIISGCKAVAGEPAKERDRAVQYAEAAPHPGSAPWKEMQAVYAERDHLRNIVRRLADLSESLLANYEYRYREDPNSMAFVGNARDFIREARAAIGEDKP